MKLFHVADIHLGKKRFGGKLPEEDLAKAFQSTALSAIAEGADLFLIAGDLFDRPTIDPEHLEQALLSLEPLKKANIPVIAIEGNHDRPAYRSESKSWLSYLSQQGYLSLLTTPFSRSGPLITAWDQSSRSGSFLDIGDYRFVGCGYLGAGTPKRLQMIADALPNDKPIVMLLHAAPDTFVGELGGFSKEERKALQDKVKYLALGHLHKPLLIDDWICNPGSLETLRMSEVTYPEKRGLAVCDLTSGHVEIRSCSRRPIRNVSLDCTEIGKKRKGIEEALFEACHQLLEGEDHTIIHLKGSVPISRFRFSVETLEKALGHATISTTSLHFTSGRRSLPSLASQQLTREEIERQVFCNLLEEHSDLPPEETASFATFLQSLHERDSLYSAYVDTFSSH